MNPTGLTEDELNLIRGVLAHHKEITGAILFGSRAKGAASPTSDIDLALDGIDASLQAQAIASDLNESSLPYRFDVMTRAAMQSGPLCGHFECVGVCLYLASFLSA